jgi:hypothetical protein
MSSSPRTTSRLSRSRRRLAVVLVIGGTVAALAPPANAAQHRSGDHVAIPREELEYRELLQQYAAGDIRAAVDAALALEFDAAQQMFQSTAARLSAELKLHKAFRTRANGARTLHRMRADRVQVLQLAALLHTDAAIVRADTPPTFDAESWLAHQAIDRLFDLKSDFEEFGPVRRLKTVKLPLDEQTPVEMGATEVSWVTVRSFVHLWYLVMATRLQDFADVERLAPLLAEANERFPDDPELLLARGSLYELQLALQLVDGSLATQIYTPETLMGWRSTLEMARADFAKAVRLAPMLLEARLRLGRVRLLAGDEDDARREFATILANGRAPAALRYLAHLFDGARAESDKQWADARQAYEQARLLIPDAQSALLGLSRLADVSRDAATARHWVDSSLSAPSDRVDPWWQYAKGQAAQLDQRRLAFRRLGLD